MVKVDCLAATSKICQAVLGKADYQLGTTKVKEDDKKLIVH